MKQWGRKAKLVALAALPVSGAAFAEIPAGVQTAIEAAGTDAAAVAGLVFIAVVGLLAFKLMRRGAH